MTCIVGVVDGGVVYVGGDSAFVSGQDRGILTEPKVVRRGEMLIGAAGNARGFNIIMHVFRPPEFDPYRQTTLAYLITDFVDALRACLIDHGQHHIEDGEERMDGSLLVGFRGGLYRVWGDYTVTRFYRSYLAIGSGEDFAHGALYATAERAPRERILTALGAAAKHVTNVAPPFTVLELP